MHRERGREKKVQKAPGIYHMILINAVASQTPWRYVKRVPCQHKNLQIGVSVFWPLKNWHNATSQRITEGRLNYCTERGRDEQDNFTQEVKTWANGQQNLRVFFHVRNKGTNGSRAKLHIIVQEEDIFAVLVHGIHTCLSKFHPVITYRSSTKAHTHKHSVRLWIDGEV